MEQMLFCEFIQAVSVPAAVKHRRHQKRIVARSDLQIVFFQDRRVVFQIVSHLERCPVFQQGFQDRQSFFALDLLVEQLSLRVEMRQGQVRCARAHAQSNADEFCRDHIQPRRLDIEGKFSLLARFAAKILERLSLGQSLDAVVCAQRRALVASAHLEQAVQALLRLLGIQVAQQRAELMLLKESAQLLALDMRGFQCL